MKGPVATVGSIFMRWSNSGTTLPTVAAMITTGLSDGYQSALVQEHAPYDVILANILPTPLMAMANDAARALKKDGILILSGLMEQHQDDVIKSHEDEGLRLMDRLNVNGWMTLVMTKP